MRIGFLVFNLDGMGGTSRSAITQANALIARDDVAHVDLVSITRSADRPHYAIDPRITVTHLADVRSSALTPEDAALHARESALVPARWDPQFTALCDVAMESALPRVDVDVLVTVTPGLLTAALALVPDRVVVVHQEHRASHDRTGGLEPLLVGAPQADVVALLTPTIEAWLHDQLGDQSPTTVVMPNPLPLGFVPRSTLDRPLITTAGRLVGEKQFPRLVDAFAEVADRIPHWRLRICGEGPQRTELVRQVRKHGLWDRVELPGSVADMGAEWAKASIAALSSRTEGFPLVLQEAMAAGVPVASFDSPSGPREIVDHEVNGLLVAPQATSGLASAILRLASDGELRRRLGTGALSTAEAWAPDAIAERWMAVFRDAFTRRGDRGRLAARAHAPLVAHTTVGATAPVDVSPAQARSTALAWAVSAVRQATDTWLVAPAHEHPSPIVIVPIESRAAVLDALGRPGCPAYLSLRDPAEAGWPERRGRVDELAADLRHGRTSVVALEPWPLADGEPTLLSTGCSVEIEFWERDVSGALVAPRRNPYADRIPASVITDDAVEAILDDVHVRSLPLMLAPTVTEVRFPVDVVYTWVDGSDPAWDAARAARLEAFGETTRASSGAARYVDHGELRWSMRSLHLFAPWVRRIHLVTAGQVPPWLDTRHERVNVVDHRDILPADALPTFSSHAIETALHRIDGLAEHFVYLNDDFLLGRPIRPEALFSPSGQTSVFFSRQNVGLGVDESAAPFLQAAVNNRRLLADAFGAVSLRNLAHAPYAHRVSVLRALEERFPDALAATARTPFRSGADVSTLSSLAQHYGLLTGTAHVADLDEHPLTFVNLSNAGVDGQLRRALQREQDFLCLGDHHDHALDTAGLDASLAAFFEQYLPIAAPWERA